MPLEAVLRGIDAAFEKWRARKVKTQMVNSLAFCAQAVLTEAQIMAGTAPALARHETAPPFRWKICAVHGANAAALPAGYEETAQSLRRLAAEAEQHYADLEGLEQRLTVLGREDDRRRAHPPERRRAIGYRAASWTANFARIGAK